MSGYKKNASSNRDALFGDAGGGGGGKKKSSGSSKSRPSSSSGGGNGGSKSASTSRGYQSKAPPPPPPTTTTRLTKGSKKQAPKCVLSDEARATKLREAEDYKAKATQAMQKSFFSSPDPVAASTYYKRAADCYQAVCDVRLERLYRLESARCNNMIGAWASAANDFTRAADLALLEDDGGGGDDKSAVQMASDHYKQAAEAWTQCNEKAKAAGCQVKAALALNANEPGSMLSQLALAGIEEAVEAHVPDVLNPFARYRQTGVSAFVDPNDASSDVLHPTQGMIELANTHLVSRSYAHEPLLDLVYQLSDYSEYASALYATGAARTLLERDGVSTLTLSRVYVMETILMLAMGDPIAAEQVFLSKHVQSTPYLSSRECKLSEDLFRAVKVRDGEGLEEARNTAGSNRGGLANLHPSLQRVVQQLRLSGVARKTEDSERRAKGDKTPSSGGGGSGSAPEKKKKSKSSSSSGKSSSKPEKTKKIETPPEPEPAEPSLNDVLNMKTGYEQEAEAGARLDGAALSDELADLDFGLGSDEEDEDDDDFDLR